MCKLLNEVMDKFINSSNFKVSLNGDGMVNLNKMDIEFKSNFDVWEAVITSEVFFEFLEKNNVKINCKLNFNNEIIDNEDNYIYGHFKV